MTSSGDIISVSATPESQSSTIEYSFPLTDYDVTTLPGTPLPPENLTIYLILATSVTLKWSVPHQDIREFSIFVEPLYSDWICVTDNDTGLSAFEVTGIGEWRRSYSVTRLLPSTRYTMHMVTVNEHGISNRSHTVYFTTLADTTEAHPSFSVKPVEVFLVICILLTWLLTIAMFLKKWGALRIISTSEPNYRAKKPQGIDSVQVIDATSASESVINFGHSKNMCKTMAERERRFERMHTMPNIKIDLETDSELSQNPELEPRPRLNSAGSKPIVRDSGFNLKSVNPMSFAIPSMIVKSKPAKVVRQATVLDPCIEESCLGQTSSPKRISCMPHSKSYSSYIVNSDDTNTINTSTV